MTQQNKPQDQKTQNASMQKPQSGQQQQQGNQPRGQQGSGRPTGNFAGTQTGKSGHGSQPR
jgi:hypothetical protein